MGNIVIPEAEFEQFLRSLFAKVTKAQEELIAEFRARLAAKEVLLGAQLEVMHERKMKAAEEKVERKLRAAEEEIERKVCAIEEEIYRKARAADEEIARLRQLERIRHTYEAEPETQLQ